ncbi:MAG: hypothetical protein ACK55C_00395 [bacterium]
MLYSLAEALFNQTVINSLIAQLDTYSSTYHLVSGASQVVVARQIINHVQGYADGEIWMREFFLEKITIGTSWRIDDGGVIFKV